MRRSINIICIKIFDLLPHRLDKRLNRLSQDLIHYFFSILLLLWKKLRLRIIEHFRIKQKSRLTTFTRFLTKKVVFKFFLLHLSNLLCHWWFPHLLIFGQISAYFLFTSIYIFLKIHRNHHLYPIGHSGSHTPQSIHSSG